MKDNHNLQTGFSVIEALLVVVIVCLLAILGFMVYNNRHRLASKALVATPSANKLASPQPPVTTTKAGNAGNVYAGWKSFCSSRGGLCVQYPTNWTLSQVINKYNDEVDKIISPSGLVAVVYLPQGSPAGPGVGTQSNVNVVSVNQAAASGYEVVSLYKQMPQLTTSNYAADIFLVPASSTNTNQQPYAAGMSYASAYEPQFYMFNDAKLNKYSQQMDVEISSSQLPAQNLFSSQTAAVNWMNSSEVKTATQILESVSYKN